MYNVEFNPFTGDLDNVNTKYLVGEFNKLLIPLENKIEEGNKKIGIITINIGNNNLKLKEIESKVVDLEIKYKGVKKELDDFRNNFSNEIQDIKNQLSNLRERIETLETTP